MNILVIGGSRNIGYFSAIRFLDAGHRVTFLLRSPSVFDDDQVVQSYIKSNKAYLVKGDALIKEDVKRVWDETAKLGTVDLLLFTVGGVPKFHLVKGFTISPANLVTQSILNVLCTMPSPAPKIIAISSAGVTHTSHASLPLMLKPVYGYLLAVPHKDKIGAERVLAHCTGWKWDTKNDGEPGVDIMGTENWMTREGLPASGTLKEVLVVRPALLTDGECMADKKDTKSYRASETELKGWTISRKDVAHFVVDAALNKWEEYRNKRINVVY